jgi:hypothetical protein
MKNLIGKKIKNFSVGSYHNISIELNDGSKYTANLNSFSDVYCYPKNIYEWSKATIGEFRADIEWESGFGVHLDQIAFLSLQQNQTAI